MSLEQSKNWNGEWKREEERGKRQETRDKKEKVPSLVVNIHPGESKKYF